MKLFDVYSIYNIEPISAKGSTIYDVKGQRYLDFYGGHAVISVGHSHPYYIEMLKHQISKLGFYSNAVINNLQQSYADKLGKLSGYDDYELFLCNSGAEANENALKLASFHTGKKRVLAFNGAFHGRTSGAVAITDIPSYSAPYNQTDNVTFVQLNDTKATETELAKGDYAAVIVEGIQGVSGIHIAEDNFLQQLQKSCEKHDVILILDEIQSGCGRTGKYFSHQFANIRPDIITMAKGIGNGFPMAALLINDKIKAVKGQLGTTFGGNHLACAAGIAVVDVIKHEKLIEKAAEKGKNLKEELKSLSGIKEVRGRGLMLAIEMEKPVSDLRNKLVYEHHIFTGGAGTHVIRLLPPLCITDNEIDQFLTVFKSLI